MPSIMNRARQLEKYVPVWIWVRPKANMPPKALARALNAKMTDDLRDVSFSSLSRVCWVSPTSFRVRTSYI